MNAIKCSREPGGDETKNKSSKERKRSLYIRIVNTENERLLTTFPVQGAK